VTRLLLLRHAESEWNAQGRWQGLADPPLSDRGELQATRAGPRLAATGFTTLVASDLQRARNTARLIAPALGLAVAVDPGLREYDVGQWSGLTRPEIEQRWPGALDHWRNGRLLRIPGGERRDVFVARIAATVARLGAANPGQVMLVITHGGVISALERSLAAEPRRLGHLSGRWVRADDAGLHPEAAVELMGGGAPEDPGQSPFEEADGESTGFQNGTARPPEAVVSPREG